MHPHETVVRFGKANIGGTAFAGIAGPCAVETEDRLRASASAVRSAGAIGIRAGAYKPRSSPYSFQGHGPEGLATLRKVGDELELPVVTEVMDTTDVDIVAEQADMLQVGARNMQNFSLLKALGKIRKPVLLKRGLAAKVEDLLLAAEYLLAAGNEQVILCERGIRTFETVTRNTLDLNAVAYMKQKTHLPVLVDPSHGTGVRDLVIPMSLAAAACGADGVLDALSSGGQPVLDLVARKLAQHVQSAAPERVVLRYERSQEVDAEKRLLAPSPFEVLRTISTGFRSETPEEAMTVCLIGVVAFDHVDLFEELPQSPEDPTDFPDFIFWLAESAVVAEPRLTPRLVCASFAGADPEEQKRAQFSSIERLGDLSFRSSDVRALDQSAGTPVEVSVDLDDD